MLTRQEARGRAARMILDALPDEDYPRGSPYLMGIGPDAELVEAELRDLEAWLIRLAAGAGRPTTKKNPDRNGRPGR